jgi:hypothetical protein
MRQHEIREYLRHEPFRPFRVHLSNGQSHDVRHLELAALTRHSVVVVLPEDGSRETNGDAPDRIIQCDLVHVVALDPLNGDGP